jgi:hypothetical protein
MGTYSIIFYSGKAIPRFSGKLFYSTHPEAITNKLTNPYMRSLLYLIAVILIIGWLLGVFYYSATGLIHVLVVLAVVSLLLGVIRRA